VLGFYLQRVRKKVKLFPIHLCQQNIQSSFCKPGTSDANIGDSLNQSDVNSLKNTLYEKVQLCPIPKMLLMLGNRTSFFQE